jgi:hypothetical protein
MNKYTTYCLLAFASIALILGYYYLAIPNCLDYAKTCFPIPGAPVLAPFRYRLLQPALEALLAPNAGNAQLLFTDFMLQSVLSPVIIVGLWLWLKRWADDARALIGVLVFTAVMVVSFHFYMRGIATTIEIACVLWTLVYIDRFWIVGLLTIIASLNRETGLIIPALYCFYHFESFSKPEKSITGWPLIAYSVLITDAIHIALGSSDHVLGLVGTLQYNLQNAGDAIFSNLLLIPLIIAATVGYKTLPTALKRLLWVALLYCGAIAVGGAWNEAMRLILPVLPIALAAAMVKVPVKASIGAVPISYFGGSTIYLEPTGEISYIKEAVNHE